MYIKIGTGTSTGGCSEAAARLRDELERADAVLIGAGAGLSASAGLTYDGPRFERLFSDFIERYHVRDMYSAGFYPYPTPEEFWAYWSRHIYYNRYDQPVGAPYRALLELVRGRDYFVITTNVDHQFQLAGFEKARLFYTQGDYGLWQCAAACHAQTYDNEETVRQMVARQEGMRVPLRLVPFCPVCGAPMAMNLRCDERFVEDAGWYAACRRYEAFLKEHRDSRVLYLELGVGGNTPGIIKYPFWRMTNERKNSIYVCVNNREAYAPEKIGARSICVNGDIGEVLNYLNAVK